MDFVMPDEALTRGICNYSNVHYALSLRLKLARIRKSSRGVRLPAGLIRRYGLAHGLQAEPMPEGILAQAFAGS